MSCSGKKCGAWSLKWDVEWDGSYDWFPKGGGASVPHTNKDNPMIINDVNAIKADVADVKKKIDDALKNKDKGIVKCDKPCHCFEPDPPVKPQGYSATLQFKRKITAVVAPPPGTLHFTVTVKFTYIPPQGECVEIPIFEGGEWISLHDHVESRMA
jgi:hypothetical protein